MFLFYLIPLLFINNIYTTDCKEEKTFQSKGTLLFAHVLFRHGDRTPIDPYPNDPWGNTSFWPVGWGQLTNLGKQQHFHLGQWLRNRYQHILSDAYSKDVIYVQSTDVDRTLMSALSNLAGLFPPTPDLVWNANINWQPIPVHTIPERLDTTLSAKKPCPAFDHALKIYKNSDEYRQLNEKFKPLYKYLSEHAGRKVDTFTGVNNLYNNLFIEDINNKTLPNWTKKVYPAGDMKWIADRSFATNTITPKLARLKGGFLLREILERFRNKTNSALKPDRSMWMYSAHDTTVANLLNTLGLFEYHSPQYTACVMLELRVYKEKPLIQIFYKNTTEEPRPMYIPDCGYQCPLEDMFKLYHTILPGDYDEECKLSALKMSFEDAVLGAGMGFVITGAILSILALLIFIVITLHHRRNYSDSKWYLRIDS